MAFEPCIIAALFVLAVSAFLIWSRHSIYWLIESNFLSDEDSRYRQERLLLYHTKKCLHYLYRESRLLKKNPGMAENILRRMMLLLPHETILAEQRAYLQNAAIFLHRQLTAYYAKQSSLPAKGHKIISALTRSFSMLASVKNHLNRIDKAAQGQEQKMRCLLQLAQNFAAVHRINQFRTCIKVAKYFQNSNINILKAISRTERKLSAMNKSFNSLKKQ